MNGNKPYADNVSLIQLFGKSLLSLIIIIVTVFLLSHFFGESLKILCSKIYENFGGILVPVGYFSTSFLLPFIPDDMFSATALLGGLNPWFVFICAWVGSSLGACTAYFFGLKLNGRTIFKKITNQNREQVQSLLSKYGIKAFGIVALTPLPDAPFSWICGAFKIPFLKFILTYILCRGIKVGYAIYLLYITIGVNN